MVFTAAKAELSNAIAIVIRAVPARSTMNILECILIEARPNELILTANDLDMGITTHIVAQVEEPGIVAADAKMLQEIIKKAPGKEVRIETNESLSIRIKSGKAKFEIGGKTGEEFPEMPEIEKDEAVEIVQPVLKSLITDTVFAVSMIDANRIMTGELIEIRGDVMRVVALDGHRVAMRKVALKQNYGERKAIVPGKALTDVSKILSGEMDDTVNLYFTRNHVLFELPDTVIISRLIDGDYFKVDQMLSDDYETKVTVNRNKLLSCVDRATLFIHEGDKKPIIFEAKDNSLRIVIESARGSMNEEIPIAKEGRDIDIGFNPHFMIDALKAISDENVTLYMISAKSPCFIRDDKSSYIYLVLPMNFVRGDD